MTKYHGLPITPQEAAVAAISGGAAFVSFAHPEQFDIAAACAAQIAGDNGGWSAKQAGKPVEDWRPFYAWMERIMRHPAFDFAIIPDVIDGTEEENLALVKAWPFSMHIGTPVWHLNESLDYLDYLVNNFPRIALGSSGQYQNIGTAEWFHRMDEAMRVICDKEGRPKCKIHGLRMLDVAIYTRFPFSSADSTNIARNIGIDSRWTGAYSPLGRSNKAARAAILRQRIESEQSPGRYEPRPFTQNDLFPTIITQ